MNHRSTQNFGHKHKGSHSAAPCVLPCLCFPFGKLDRARNLPYNCIDVNLPAHDTAGFFMRHTVD